MALNAIYNIFITVSSHKDLYLPSGATIVTLLALLFIIALIIKTDIKIYFSL